MTPADNLAGPLIDGTLVASTDDATLDVINPSNGKRCFAIPKGSAADCDRAVASARRVFDSGQWSEAPPTFRKKIVHRLADLIERDAAVLDRLDAEEMGKPVGLALANAAGAAGFMCFCAEGIDKITGDVYPSDTTTFVVQRRVPRGVIAAIVPWNFPTYNAVLKLGPALATGNCLVLKPSELSTRSALHLTQLALEAGLPPGVLNLVPGVGETTGRALGLHNDVDMVAFTGSTAVGKLLLQFAGQSNMKVVQAECGGKSPQILFDDGVDLDAAARAIAQFLLVNQGQLCSVGSRLLVQRSIEPAILDKIRTHLSAIVMGDALDPKTTFGPLVSAKQRTRVLDYIASGREEGAELLLGGQKALDASGGFFVQPTLFRGVSPRSRIAREEIFGPVLSVIAFQDEAEAIRIANDTTYGLAAYVWTANLSRGMRMAKALRSPVFINARVPEGEGAGHAASWEPARESGIGTEGGLAGMESYLRRQLVWFNH